MFNRITHTFLTLGEAVQARRKMMENDPALSTSPVTNVHIISKGTYYLFSSTAYSNLSDKEIPRYVLGALTTRERNLNE